MATALNPSDSGGLRERKKQQTREDLSMAALRLVVERGFANVLVEDIAAAAGVSTRTFNNYFAGKAEAITFRHLDRARRTAVEFEARPTSEPLWDALSAAILGVMSEGAGSQPDPNWTAGVRLMVADPALAGELMKAAAAADQEMAIAVARRTGTDVDRDLYPRLVAVAVGGVIAVAMSQWATADPPVPLTDLLRESLRQIRAGLPDPRST
jgi:AcrR family transcriptional regulator